MLRVTYAGRESAFEFRGIKKSECRDVLLQHIALWGHEQIDTPAGVKRVPITGMSAAWQDGDNWDLTLPGEPIPVPGSHA